MVYGKPCTDDKILACQAGGREFPRLVEASVPLKPRKRGVFLYPPFCC